MIHVTDVSYIDGYRLTVTFSDGTSGTADLGELVARSKALAPLRDKALFSKAYADHTVCWPGDHDIATEAVYALAHGLAPPKTWEDAQRNELEVSLRELRRLSGKTQVELSEEMGMAQGEISKLERREDMRVSTLKRYVGALGGRIEIVAVIGDKRVTLRGAA